MGGILVKSQSVFTLHLDGNSAVDADVVVQAIQNMSVITSEISKAEDPQILSKLQVQPFRNGSFEILFITVAEIGMSVINDPVLMAGISQKIVEILFKCFEIRKHLKGEEPKSVTYHGDCVHIENEDGQVIYAPAAAMVVVNNNSVNTAVANVAAYAAKNNPSGGFSMESKDDPNLNLDFSAEDVHNIAAGSSVEKEYRKQCTQSVEIMPIKAASFMGNAKWSFILHNKTIFARIEDEEWLDNVQSGLLSIKASDRIKARVETSVELDGFGFPVHGTEKYTIIKVIELLSENNEISEKQISFEK